VVSHSAVKDRPTKSDRSRIERAIADGKSLFTLQAPSSALCALALFVMLNLLFFSCSLLNFDPYKFPYRGWSWWIVNDLRSHSQEHHSIALLGSSLIVSAVAGCDANYLNRQLEMTEYHKAAYLDHVLADGDSTTFNTIDLAIPGQIPSDAYMMLRTMTNIATRPEVVLYGVAPRDFLDNTLHSPLDTEPCHYLSRLVDYKEIEPGLYNDPLSKFNRFLEQNVYFYHKSTDLQMRAIGVMNRAIDFAVPKPRGAKQFTYWDRKALVPSYHAGEMYPSAMVASPVDRKYCATHIVNNQVDYIDRYKHARPDVFATQLYFLQQLSRFCHRNGTELILVNMPLTLKNVQILTMPRYDAYRKQMQTFANKNNIVMLDLADFNKYPPEDFQDTVHLNAFGAKKFFDSLAAALHANPTTAGYIRRAAAASSNAHSTLPSR
jgi:hypothetical protein